MYYALNLGTFDFFAGLYPSIAGSLAGNRGSDSFQK
jgi:hypothetical protein